MADPAPGSLQFAEIPRLPDHWWDGAPKSDPAPVWTVWDRSTWYTWGANSGNYLQGPIGSLIGGGKKKDRYDCEAALDGYLTQYGAPGTRVAAREIAYAPYPAAPAYSYGYGYPANYGYAYAPPPQMVIVPVRSEVQQQVVVRETVREETYTVPGAARVIPATAPSPKMIKGGR